MNEQVPNPNMPAKCPQCGAVLPSGALDGLCPACLLQQGVAETATQPEAPPFQPPTVEEVARLFPQLEILGFIGKGGMGAVYKARQPALDRFVALKILPSQAASGAGFGERFNREARALAKLNHPNIVTLYEFGQAEALPFFIMEFVDGLNLRQLERAGRLSPREALEIVPQICEALQFAHDEGIVHRDIKPENILLGKKGRVKIADFGIAKIMGPEERDLSISETNQAIGTPLYMAPEQLARPQSVDHRADIYSLGVVFYEMLTGELPLGKFGPPSSQAGGMQVDVRLDEVVLRALEKEPSRRYQQASQVKSAVDTITNAPPPPPPGVDADLLARQILARDPVLDIGSCLRRGWALVRGDFWPLIGINALVLALLAVANAGTVAQSSAGSNWTVQSSVIGLLVNGPLAAGLFLHFLRRKRGEVSGVETVFSGFSSRYLHLFLGAFVTFSLMALGFVCLILPGIYLLVAWMFTLALIIDKKLDFWPAMELSRKTVTKHWWKFLGFWLLTFVLKYCGLLLCGFGLFFTAPIALAALVYAYDDIFGLPEPAPSQPPVGFGPHGTAVSPGAPPPFPIGATGATGGPHGPSASPTAPQRPGGPGAGPSKPVVIGLAAVILVVGIAVLANIYHRARTHRIQNSAFAVVPQPLPPAFGRVIERVVNTPSFHNSCLDLNSGDLLDLPGIPPAGALSEASRSNAWQSLAPLLLQKGINLVCGSGADSVQVFLTAVVPVSDEVFDSITAEELLHHDQLNPQEIPEEARETGRQLAVSPAPSAWLFETHEGNYGVMRISSPSGEPRGAKIEFKLVTPTPDEARTRSTARQGSSQENLDARMQAASMITDINRKDQSLAETAIDAAKAGQGAIAHASIQQINSVAGKDEAASQAAKLLSKHGLRSPAVEIAGEINNLSKRDETFAQLAVDAAGAGDGQTTRDALQQINNLNKKDETALEAVRRLVKRGLRKQALEIVPLINNSNTRDEALADLAR
jgi:predicted Ser/Thr protein kinase